MASSVFLNRQILGIGFYGDEDWTNVQVIKMMKHVVRRLDLDLDLFECVIWELNSRD